MKLTGARILIETLIEQGTDVVFGYPGGAVLNIYDELYLNSDRIKHIITAHEQGAAHAADGYARASGKVGVVLAFNKALAKQVYAGADIFLMPSKSEPCGLSQRIASAYGTVPVVRAIGGLRDTIHPYNPETGEGNGITFESYNAHDMMDAVRRAKELYGKAEHWNALVRNAMTADFSWDASAVGYLSIYNDLTEN